MVLPLEKLARTPMQTHDYDQCLKCRPKNVGSGAVCGFGRFGGPCH